MKIEKAPEVKIAMVDSDSFIWAAIYNGFFFNPVQIK